MADMTPDRFLELLGRILVWSDGDRRAPHKPLLLLWAFGRVGWGDFPRLTPFRDPDRTHRTRRDDVETQLDALLTRFGRPTSDGRQHPEHPFLRLPNDGLWELEIPDHLAAQIAGTARWRAGGIGKLPKTMVRQFRGGLPAPIWQLLRKNPGLVQRAAQLLLDKHFPESRHANIRRDVGLPSGPSLVRDRARRDPRFRPEVLRAYEQRCAVCNFDARIDNSLMAVEAAHIKWHTAGGPSAVDNGLALCVIHHNALDSGAIGLEPCDRNVIVLVSDRLSGSSQAFRQQLLAFVGRPLRRPQHREMTPAPDFVAWHRREVFLGRPRESDSS